MAGPPSRLARNLGAKAAAEGTARLLRVGAAVLAARWLGTEEYGAYAQALAAAWVAAQVADLGLPTFLARQVSETPGRVREILARALRARLAGTILVAALAGLAAAHAAPGQDLVLAGVVLIAVLLHSCLDLLNGALRGLQDLVPEAVTTTLHALLGALLGLGAVRAGQGARGLASGLAVAAAVSLVVAAIVLRRRLPRADDGPRPAPGALAAARVLVPVAVAELCAQLYVHVDLLVLWRHETPAAVGQMAAALRVVSGAMLIPLAVMAAVLPSATARAASDPRGLSRLCGRTLGGLALAGGAVAVGLAAASRPLVFALFGGEYAEAAGLVRILSVCVLASFLEISASQLLLARGGAGAYALLRSGMLGLNLVGDLFWIPSYGATGAAWAKSLSTAAAALAGGVLLAARLRRPSGPGEGAWDPRRGPVTDPGLPSFAAEGRGGA